MTRPKNLLSSDTVAQALAAFHGRPGLAYHRKSEIWESDEQYSSIFNDHTHAPHIIFTYSLYQSIVSIKEELAAREKGKEIRRQEATALEFLRLRGSVYLLMAAISHSMETFLDRSIPSSFDLRFDDSVKMTKAISVWKPIVLASLPFQAPLRAPIEKGLENKDEVDNALDAHANFVTSIQETLAAKIAEFAKAVHDGAWRPKAKRKK